MERPALSPATLLLDQKLHIRVPYRAAPASVHNTLQVRLVVGETIAVEFLLYRIYHDRILLRDYWSGSSQPCTRKQPTVQAQSIPNNVTWIAQSTVWESASCLSEILTIRADGFSALANAAQFLPDLVHLASKGQPEAIIQSAQALAFRLKPCRFKSTGLLQLIDYTLCLLSQNFELGRSVLPGQLNLIFQQAFQLSEKLFLRLRIHNT